QHVVVHGRVRRTGPLGGEGVLHDEIRRESGRRQGHAGGGGGLVVVEIGVASVAGMLVDVVGGIGGGGRRESGVGEGKAVLLHDHGGGGTVGTEVLEPERGGSPRSRR